MVNVFPKSPTELPSSQRPLWLTEVTNCLGIIFKSSQNVSVNHNSCPNSEDSYSNLEDHNNQPTPWFEPFALSAV